MKVGQTLFFLWLAHLFMDFFTGIWPIYKTIAGIDIAKAGLIIGISGFLGEILQLFFGYICDRGHRKKILILGVCLASAILLVTLTKSIAACFFILLLLMIGSGAFHPAAAGMASTLIPSHRARTILIFTSGGAIGLGISQISFVKLLEVFNGHAFVIFVPLMIVVFMIVFYSFPKQVVTHSHFSLKGFFTPLAHRKKEMTLLYCSQVATQALTMGIYFLLPDLLQSKACHSWLCLGGGHLCFVIGSSLTMIPAGFLCDKYGQKSVLLCVLGGAILLLYFFLAGTVFSLGSSILLLTLLGAFIGIINPIIVSWGNQLVPESPSTVSALLMGCAWCIGNLGPAAAGLITRLFVENAYTKTLFSVGSLLFIIFFFILFMPRQEKSFADITPGQ